MKVIQLMLSYLLISTMVYQLVEQSPYAPYVSFVVGLIGVTIFVHILVGLPEDIDEKKHPFSSINQVKPSHFREELYLSREEESVEKQIGGLLWQEHIKANHIVASLNEKGDLTEIHLRTSQKWENKIKTIIFHVYHLPKKNIHIRN